MMNLLDVVKNVSYEAHNLPFSVYSSIKEQRLLNVPISKPVLVVMLKGDKELGGHELICRSGNFIFLHNKSVINMRNIPENNEYLALLIEFDYQDYNGLQVSSTANANHVSGAMDLALEKCLQQFVESSLWAPEILWSWRKREILSLLCHMGYQEVLSLFGEQRIKDRLHELFIDSGGHDLSLGEISQKLAMSESTLRRKLKSEGVTVQEVKDQATWFRFALTANYFKYNWIDC